MRGILALACALLTACGPGALPAPAIYSVQPAETPANVAAEIALALEAILPFRLDYADEAAAVDWPTLQLAGASIPLEPTAQRNVFRARIPAGLDPGTHDVVVRLSDGRSAVLADAFEVTPALRLSGFEFDTIPDQQVGVPFDITLRAQGMDAAAFSGFADLSASRGEIAPQQTGRFIRGVRTETVTLDASNRAMALTARNGGSQGRSNAFTVTP